jgi:hypothetical protein
MLQEKTIVNENGENIHIRIKTFTTQVFRLEDKSSKKITEKEISIHHEDANDDFIPISKFLCDTVISSNELISIYNAIKELAIQDFLTTRI